MYRLAKKSKATVWNKPSMTTNNNINYVRYLFDTRYRSSGTQNEPTFTLPTTINMTSLKILEVEIPLSTYSIRDGINNKIDFNDGAVRTADLTPGNYTRARLQTEIVTAMQAVSGLTFTASISKTDYTLTLTGSGAFSLLFASGPNAPAVGSKALTVNKILGFDRADTASSTTQQGTNPVLLGGENYIFLTTDLLDNNTNTLVPVGNNDVSGIIARLQLNVPSGSYLLSKDISFVSSYFGLSDINSITFSLKYANGELVDLNGVDWSVLIEVNIY